MVRDQALAASRKRAPAARYTPNMTSGPEDDGPRAEDLITLSGAARRIADLVAASESPLRYEVIRHLLRVSEETMTEVLEESVHVRLVKRGDDPFTYIPYSDAIAADIAAHMDTERRDRIRKQIASATNRVFE